MAELEFDVRALDAAGTSVVAKIIGAIDGSTHQEFQAALDDIRGQGVIYLIMDFSQVKYVNSTGLGALVKAADVFKAASGGIALIKVPPKVKIVIEMLGLQAFFQILKGEEEAKQVLGIGVAAPPSAPEPEPEAAPEPEPPRKPVVAQPAAQRPAAPAKPAPTPTPRAAPASVQPAAPGPTVRAVPSPPARVVAPAPAAPAARAAEVVRPLPFADAKGPIRASEPSPQPVPAPVAAPAQPSGFPFTTNCESCGVTLEFPNFGNFRCPRCFTLASLSTEGEVSFLVPGTPNPLQLTLSTGDVSTEGLKGFVSTLTRRLALDVEQARGVEGAIHEVCDVIKTSAYEGLENCTYHVLVEAHNGRLAIQISDWGRPVPPDQHQALFPRARGALNEFECKANPGGGNLYRLVKLGS